MIAIIDIGAIGLFAAFSGTDPEQAEERWRALSEAQREKFRNDMRNAMRSLNAHGYSVKHASDIRGN